MTNVLVTGASGFLGGALIRDLSTQPDFSVRAISRRRPPWLEGFDVWSGDLGGAQGPWLGALSDVDTVVHLAGPNEVAFGREPDRASARTTQMARSVALAAVAAGVSRLVYVSTVHVYGTAIIPGALLSEATTPVPTSAYAESRYAAEQTLSEILSPQVELVILRLTNCIGPPVDPGVDRWSLLANDLCRQAVTEGRLQLATSGDQWRDFISLTDVRSIVAAFLRPAGVSEGIYNLGSGKPTTVKGLAHLIQKVASQTVLPYLELTAPVSLEPGPASHTVSVRRLAAEGLSATSSLSASVLETLEFCVAHRDQLLKSST